MLKQIRNIKKKWDDNFHWIKTTI